MSTCRPSLSDTSRLPDVSDVRPASMNRQFDKRRTPPPFDSSDSTSAALTAARCRAADASATATVVFDPPSLTSSASTSSPPSTSTSVSSPAISPASLSSHRSLMGETGQPYPASLSTRRGLPDDSNSSDGEDIDDDDYDIVDQLTDASQPPHDGHAVKRQHIDSISGRSSPGVSVPSSPIPSFTSSSEPSSSPPQVFARDSLSSGPARRRRRKISDLGAGEIWECPLYLCHKRYKKTSIQSIALHKAKCGSRPQLQQLMSQQEEQMHKDRLLQQQQRQLHEQQVMLNRQQEEQQRQLMALESARHTLLMMQQQQQMQQLMPRAQASGPFMGQSPQSFGLLPAGATPFATLPPSGHQQLPMQQFSLSQSVSYPASANATVEVASPTNSSFVSNISPVTQSTAASQLASPSILPLTVPNAQPASTTQQYPPQYTQSAFAHPSQLQHAHNQQQQQQQQQQNHQANTPWSVGYSLSGSASLPPIASSSLTVSASLPLPVGPFGSLMSMIPVSTTLPPHYTAQAQQQQATQLSTLQSPSANTSPPLPLHQPLVLPHQPQAHLAQPHWLTGASSSLPNTPPTHFVNAQATSLFLTSPSLSPSASFGALPISVQSSSRPPSHSPPGASFATAAALSPDKSASIVSASPSLISLPNVSSFSSLPSTAGTSTVSLSSTSSAFVSSIPTFSR